MQGLISSVPQGVERLLSSDTAQSLDLVTAFPDDVNELLVTCEGNPVRIGLGGTVPTQGATCVGLKLDPGATLWLGSRAAVRTFQYISEAASTAGVLQVVKLVGSN